MPDVPVLFGSCIEIETTHRGHTASVSEIFGLLLAEAVREADRSPCARSGSKFLTVTTADPPKRTFPPKNKLPKKLKQERYLLNPS
jgi:hypothetical protein